MSVDIESFHKERVSAGPVADLTAPTSAKQIGLRGYDRHIGRGSGMGDGPMPQSSSAR